MSETIFKTQVSCIFANRTHIESDGSTCTLLGITPNGWNVEIPNGLQSIPFAENIGFHISIYGPYSDRPNSIVFEIERQCILSDGTTTSAIIHRDENIGKAIIEKEKKSHPESETDAFFMHIRGNFGPIPIEGYTRVIMYVILDGVKIRAGNTFFKPVNKQESTTA